MLKVHLRFLFSLAAIMAISTCITIGLIAVSAHGQGASVQATSQTPQAGSTAGGPSQTGQASGGSGASSSSASTGKLAERGTELTVMIYAIALGLVGLFNMYNALEIYKKKEQINLELGELALKYRESMQEIEVKQREVVCGYKEMDVDVKRSKFELETRLAVMQKEIGQSAELHTKMLIKQVEKITDDLITRQKAIESQITVESERLNSYGKRLEQDHSKFFYTYCLCSIDPHFLEDQSNRTRVHSAAMWLCQNGEREELELLKERRSKIPLEDEDMHAVFGQAIKELESRLRTSD